MKNFFRNSAFLLFFLGANASAATQDLATPRDGWASWPVAAVANAPNWCCLEWHEKSVTPATCNLDGPQQGYSSSGRDDTTNETRIYARFNAGKLTRLRTLAASCPVKTETAIKAMNEVSADASVAWLVGVVYAQSSSTKTEWRLASDALAALAVHRGEAALGAISAIARKNAHIENRKDALFWLGQVRGQEGAEVIAPAMFEDPDARVREHAGFSISQSRSTLAVPSLIKQGNTDRSTQVRSQAWFWLSQTKSPEAEAAINRAVRNDPDASVRTQAVFALSQLPAERALAALVSVAEDKSVARGDRKQAVFWIGQSGSDGAVKFLDRVLNARAGN
jgi:HEAT repeat protein